MNENDYPSLYTAADETSKNAQKIYFFLLMIYLIFLVVGATVSLYWNQNSTAAIISAITFFITLGILLYLNVKKPNDIWYNGRAVAESVKTRTWRWTMRADPYCSNTNLAQSKAEFLNDLRAILKQNRKLTESIDWSSNINTAISDRMLDIRNKSIEERFEIYKTDRIEDQRTWYSKKAKLNKRRSDQWFIVSIVLHSLAILLLLLRIKNPLSNFPIEIIATIASGVLTWVQAKKFNELHSSYSLTAHEIVLIKSETLPVIDEEHFSEFVINTESAFSREHTQWVARKTV